MRTFSPLSPPKDIDPRIYSVLTRINNYLEHASTAWGSISRGELPDGGTVPITEPPAGTLDHGSLSGLTSVLSGTTVLDHNDDHTQLALLRGRPAGQYYYGSRDSTSGNWNPIGTCFQDAEANDTDTYLTSIGAVVADVPVGDAIIVVVSSSFFSVNAASSGEDTNWHLTMTNNGDANTWVKLKEWSHLEGTLTQRTVSVWYSILGNALTAAGTTLTVNMTTPGGGWAMSRKAMEGFNFRVGAGSTITLVDDTGSAQDDATQPDSLALTGSGKRLYLRGIGAFGFSVNDPELFVPTSGFTSFADDHSLSTTFDGDVTKYVAARGEFNISTLGQTSAPTNDGPPSNVYDYANLFLLLSLTTPASGLLNLGSVDDDLAANILLNNSTITANMDFFNFQDAGGSSTLSYIDGSDGAFHGRVVLDPKEKLLNTDLFDDVSAGAAVRGDVLIGNSTPAWAALAKGSAGTYLSSDGTDLSWTSFATTGDATYLRLDATNDPVTAMLEVSTGGVYHVRIFPSGQITTRSQGDALGEVILSARVGTTGATDFVIKADHNIGTSWCNLGTASDERMVFIQNDTERIRFRDTNDVSVNELAEVLITGNLEITGLINQAVGSIGSDSPTTTDDSDSGFVVGSHWLKEDTQQEYVATDVTVGAAVWQEITGAGSGVTKAYVPAGLTVGVPNRHQILVSGLYEIEATGLLDIEAGGKLVVLKEVA